GADRDHVADRAQPGRRRDVRELHPDGCVDQSGELRGAAPEPGREGDRYQHGDRGGGAGDRVLDPDQPGEGGHAPADRLRARGARLARHRDPGRDRRARRHLRRARGRARRRGHEGRARGGRGRASGGHHRRAQRRADQGGPRAPAPRRRHRRGRQEARRRSRHALPYARAAQARGPRPRLRPAPVERRARRIPRDGTVAPAVIDETPKLARRGTVLVVDDEEGVRASVRVILEGTCDVLEAENGAAALDLLRTQEVDLVMLDQRMPGEPGIEVLPRVLAVDPTTVVVLVTVVREVLVAVEALKRGAYDYLTKPFDVDHILLLAQRALEKRALEREVLCLRSALAGSAPEPGLGPGFESLVGRHPEMVKIYQ